MSVDTRELTAAARLQLEGPPVLVGRPDDRQLTNALFEPVWQATRRGWLALFGICFALTGLLFSAIAYTFAVGVGTWGNNIPVAWAFGIINFVWWIGIGHAGTLISAILLLFQQKWRTSINRFAEAMTLFAVLCAGMFPIFHMGRPWFGAYWLLPYPSTLGVWPQFRSPLTWDVFAVSTYLTTSLLFWYLGL
ncbi:MAG TPA: NrfD/PsrC family molybdoenzyme membrane anchor subunit, partial [Anaeromyxobacteraceae bacterium]|nr:NrfD/PsrC family molybdoenzyme membrane anchor subunit [Anaeromyxobacteraceae bacterium]